MKRLITLAATAAAALALVACGGVDREGSRDAIIESFEAQGLTVDGDCIDQVFDKYSDDELLKWDEELQGDAPSEEAQTYQVEVLACAVAAGS
jgi:hypothetical protein